MVLRYITANAEKMRDKFVSHAGKMQLTAYGTGNIHSADYSSLIGQLTEQIDENTKGISPVICFLVLFSFLKITQGT